MNILEFTKYLSNHDIIKYVLLISFIWIFFSYTLQNQIFDLNFIVRSIIIIGIVYIVLNIDLTKKKSSKNNLQDNFKLLQSMVIQIIDNKEVLVSNDTLQEYTKKKEESNNKRFISGSGIKQFNYDSKQNPLIQINLNLDMIKDNEEVILFYYKNLELRKINFKAFNQSLLNFNNFLKLKNDLLEKKNNNYKQVKDLLDMERKNCLNNFASINLNITTSHLNHSWETLLEMTEENIRNELIKLEKILLTHHDQIIKYLDKQFYDEPITQNSYPTYTISNNISGDITKTNNYSENFTLYY